MCMVLTVVESNNSAFGGIMDTADLPSGFESDGRHLMVEEAQRTLVWENAASRMINLVIAHFIA